MGDESKRLEAIRKRINEIDSKMAELFEQRMLESRDVAQYKMTRGLPICDPVREEEVIRRNSGLINDDGIRNLYVDFQKNMMDLSKRYQRQLTSGFKVAYCGVPGAFASIAVRRMFPQAEAVPFSDFASAYRSVEDGLCDVAVLPMENSYAGEVSAVTDLMFSGSLYCNRVIELEAVQNLLACEGADLNTIREVVSHPQALSQCAGYIEKKGFTAHEYPNTAVAAKMVAEKKDVSVAAIASEECAELYGLKVLERHINSSNTNTTRFAAFTRSLDVSRSKHKMGRHFILMFTVKNEAGSLAKTLNIIGAHGYNMSSLRSRPMKDLMWNYYFYIELDGDINNEEGRSMMTELGSLCDRLKLVANF